MSRLSLSFTSALGQRLLFGWLCLGPSSRSALGQQAAPIQLSTPHWMPADSASLPTGIWRTLQSLPGATETTFLRVALNRVAGQPLLFLLSSRRAGTGIHEREYSIILPNKSGAQPPTLLWGASLEFREWYKDGPEPAGVWRGCLYLAGDSAIAYAFLRTGGYLWGKDQDYWPGDELDNRSGYFRLMAPIRVQGFVYRMPPDSSLAARCRTDVLEASGP
jgi:hypothetical protein